MATKPWQVMTSTSDNGYAHAAGVLVEEFDTEEQAEAFWYAYPATHNAQRYDRIAWMQGPASATRVVEVVDVTVAFRDGTQTVKGERIAPGIAITPSLDPDGRRTGYWTVTHEQSGRTFGPDGYADIDIVRALGDALASSGHDWTLPFDQFTDDAKAAAVAALLAARRRSDGMPDTATLLGIDQFGEGIYVDRTEEAVSTLG